MTMLIFNVCVVAYERNIPFELIITQEISEHQTAKKLPKLFYAHSQNAF